MKALILLLASATLAGAQTNQPVVKPPVTNRVVRVVRPSAMPTDPQLRLYADPLWRSITNQMSQIFRTRLALNAAQQKDNRDLNMQLRAGLKPDGQFYKKREDDRKKQLTDLEHAHYKLVLKLEAQARGYGAQVPPWLIDSNGNYVREKPPKAKLY